MNRAFAYCVIVVLTVVSISLGIVDYVQQDELQRAHREIDRLTVELSFESSTLTKTEKTLSSAVEQRRHRELKVNHELRLIAEAIERIQADHESKAE